MIQRIKTYWLVLATITILAILPQGAWAQTGWQPNFDANTHVYIDPALVKHPDYPVSLPDLSARLKQVSDKHDVSVYVVAIERTNETGSVPAVNRVDDLVLRWQGKQDFPHDRFVIILWLRYADDPSKGSVAVNVGSELKEFNLTSTDLNSTNGPVTRAISKYMPHDPNGAFVAIVENVNGSIEAVKTRRLILSVSPFVLALVVLLAVAFFLFRKRKNVYDDLKVIFDKEMADWSLKLESANALHLRLHQGYMGFLSQQADWQKGFTSTTLERFKEAVSLFADFSSRLARANKLFDDVKSKAAKASALSSGALEEALAMLTTDKIVVEGKELPIEEATLFGGLVERSEYKPAELLNAMDLLFAKTNRSLNAIKVAMEEVQGKKQELKDAFAIIHDIKARAGGNFAPHEDELATLESERSKVLENLTSNPVDSADSLTVLVERARQFKAKLTSKFSQ